MDFIQGLLGPGNTNLSSTLVLYSFVIALGVYLGKLKLGGVSLGVTFVLFVGIIMGHFGYIVDPSVLKFVREFGLILFIFAIGLQVGPGFFSSFKQGGVRLNLLAVIAIALNVVIVITIFMCENGNTSI
ncbi:MAG: transporter, partial [Muribaculaceae bacterium]|nr:transporter [Muribaculaceae bacterium]